MLIIGKAVKYAQYGGTADAALTPNMLDAGSIGIYAIDPANGMQKLVRVGSTTTGIVTATGFKGKSFRIAQGLGSGEFIISEDMDIKGILSITGSKYAAATGQTSYIGFNETNGSLNLPTLVGVKNEITIGIKEKVMGMGNEELKRYYTVNAKAGMSASEIIDLLVNEFNSPSYGEQQFTASKVAATMAAPLNVIGVGSIVDGNLAADEYFLKMIAVDAAGGVTVGSVEDSVVTTGTDSSIAVTGDEVAGAVKYRLYVGLTTNTYASGYLESPTPNFLYTGQALTAGSIPTTATAKTDEVGLKLVALDLLLNYQVFLQGDAIEGADITTTPAEIGIGTYLQLAEIEKASNVYRGGFYTASTFDKALAKTADSSKTYDIYAIKVINSGLDKTGQKATVDQLVGEPNGMVTVAFEVQGNTPGTNQQADFEDIMLALFPATQEISA